MAARTRRLVVLALLGCFLGLGSCAKTNCKVCPSGSGAPSQICAAGTGELKPTRSFESVCALESYNCLNSNDTYIFKNSGACAFQIDNKFSVLQATNSYKPVQPVQSMSAVRPVQSMSAARPVQTLSAVRPVQSLSAVRPVQSLSAVRPVQSLSAVRPVQSLSAAQPTQARQSWPAMQTQMRPGQQQYTPTQTWPAPSTYPVRQSQNVLPAKQSSPWSALPVQPAKTTYSNSVPSVTQPRGQALWQRQTYQSPAQQYFGSSNYPSSNYQYNGPYSSAFNNNGFSNNAYSNNYYGAPWHGRQSIPYQPFNYKKPILSSANAYRGDGYSSIPWRYNVVRPFAAYIPLKAITPPAPATQVPTTLPPPAPTTPLPTTPLPTTPLPTTPLPTTPVPTTPLPTTPVPTTPVPTTPVPTTPLPTTPLPTTPVPTTPVPTTPLPPDMVAAVLNYDSYQCSSMIVDGLEEPCVAASPPTGAAGSTLTGCGWVRPTFCDSALEAVAVALAAATPPDPVPDGYELLAGVGYYKFHPEPLLLPAAAQVCAGEGTNTHLAVFSQQSDYDAVWNFILPNVTTTAGVYVGYTDFDTEGTFLTITGQPTCQLSPMWFDEGEPNNGGTGEDCVMIGFNDVARLGDTFCPTPHSFLCEQTLPSRAAICNT